MKVLKFSGKTISTPDGFKTNAKIVAETGNCIVVIPSVPKITSLLEDISDYYYKKNIEGANEHLSQLKQELLSLTEDLYKTDSVKKQASDYINSVIDSIYSFSKDLFTLFEKRIAMAQGELISSKLFRLLLTENNIQNTPLPALDFMKMDKNHEADTQYIKEKITDLITAKKSSIYITEGYICRNAYDEIDDFRQGGNDYTASLIGAAVEAEEIQIWTDTDGIQTVNAGTESQSKIITDLSFEEAAELAYFGDKILHPSSILPAKLANIPVRVLSINNPTSAGTIISGKAEKRKIKAIAAKENITAITIKSGRMLLAHGFLRKIAEVFENYRTSIDMLASSEVGISLTIDNAARLDNIVDELKKHGTVSVDKDMVIICIIGDLSWDNTSARSSVLEAISELPVKLISYGGSQYNFSFLIRKEYKNETIEILNRKLFNNI